jgi:TnpA family transposase
MPSPVLTDAERERFLRFPAQIPRADLNAYFTLTASDRKEVPRTSTAPNRLGFALQLCALRYLGFCPEDLSTVPAAALQYVADQVDATPECLPEYGDRRHTRTDHALQAQAHLRLHRPDQADLDDLSTWLVARALEHDHPAVLVDLACQRLRSRGVVRPAIVVLERLVATARRRARAETHRLVAPLLTEARKTILDRLLVPGEEGRTPLTRLRESATRSSPASIGETVAKIRELQGWQVGEIDLACLTPNRRKFLAQLGRRSTNQALQRMAEERRYPILLAFLEDVHHELVDEAIDLFDRCLANTSSKAGRELDEFRLSVARATNEKVRLCKAIGTIVLDTSIPDAEVRARIFQNLPETALRQAVEECDELIRPDDDNYFDLLAQRYGYLGQFVPEFLDALPFRSNTGGASLVRAVGLLRRLNAQGLRKLPGDTPTDFIPTKWRPYVVRPDGQLDRRYFELCVLWELRGALRAGDVWLQESRRYADPETYLIPLTLWPAKREEFCGLVPGIASGRERFAQRQRELEHHLLRFDRQLPKHGTVRMEGETLVVGRLAAEEVPASAARLAQLINERLPLIDLPDLLLEVDSWTSFSPKLEHASGSEPRSKVLQVNCCASILAQACNFGLTRMAQMSDLSYDQLAWCTTWHLREETLRAANDRVVNFHFRQPLSQVWGGGTLSSSDGQRFPVAVQSTTATAIPRYFGFGRGLTFYSWTSDQFSQYGSKPTPSTMRDATYVLDGILDNETELPIVEHTTDTAGYTDLVFGLFDLLGLQFSPRLRDLGDSGSFASTATSGTSTSGRSSGAPSGGSSS